MTGSCCANGCYPRKNKASYFKFPEAHDVERLQAWIKYCQRGNFVPKKGHKLCSRHFSVKNFEHPSTLFESIGFNMKYRVRLRVTAVPDIPLESVVNGETVKRRLSSEGSTETTLIPQKVIVTKGSNTSPPAIKIFKIIPPDAKKINGVLSSKNKWKMVRLIEPSGKRMTMVIDPNKLTGEGFQRIVPMPNEPEQTLPSNLEEVSEQEEDDPLNGINLDDIPCISELEGNPSEE